MDDIVVEVTEGEENRPGAEGDVIDTESDVRTLDAHYNCFVMSFSYNDVVDSKTGEQGLRFVVKLLLERLRKRVFPTIMAMLPNKTTTGFISDGMVQERIERLCCRHTRQTRC